MSQQQSLDSHSEQRVMQALNEASLHQTTLLITHLLEETMEYDQIWVMEKGQVIETGTYQSLSQQNMVSLLVFLLIVKRNFDRESTASFSRVIPSSLVYAVTGYFVGNFNIVSQYWPFNTFWLVLSGHVIGVLRAFIVLTICYPPLGVRGAAIFRTAGRYFERLVSHDATFRVLSHLRVFTFKKNFTALSWGSPVFVKVNYLTV